VSILVASRPYRRSTDKGFASYFYFGQRLPHACTIPLARSLATYMENPGFDAMPVLSRLRSHALKFRNNGKKLVLTHRVSTYWFFRYSIVLGHRKSFCFPSFYKLKNPPFLLYKVHGFFQGGAIVLATTFFWVTT